MKPGALETMALSMATCGLKPGHRYLLDTNVISMLVRQPTGSIYQKLIEVGVQSICTSIIVAAEIHYGLAKKGSEALSTNVLAILSYFDILRMDSPTELHYADIRFELERIGRPAGANDLLIAAHARALNLTLVTHNTNEFARIPNLKLEDWIAS